LRYYFDINYIITKVPLETEANKNSFSPVEAMRMF